MSARKLMNPFGKLGRIVAMLLALVVFAPVSDMASAYVPGGTTPTVQRAVPTNSVYPAITGTLRVPNTLTASRGTWGGSPTSYTYAWHRCTTATARATSKPANCTVVDGQVNATYVLTSSDVGKFIVASVRASNASGSLTRWSAATATAVVAQYLPPSNSTAPVVTGTATVSQTLSISNGSWTETPTSYAYQWYRCNARQTAAANSVPAGCVAISGAGTSTYALVAADATKFVTASVVATNSTGSTAKFAISTAAVASLPVPANTVTPSVTGTAQISRILSVSNGSWNYVPTTYTYQWYRCTAAKATSDTLPAGCSAISGATSSTYQLLTADSARWVSAAVTARNTTGTKTKWAATTTTITTPAAYAPSVARNPAMTFSADNTSAINGSAMVGSVLVASKGQWLGYPLPEVSYSYWYRCDAAHETSGTVRPSDCYAISGSNGANGETYLITVADIGKYLAFETIATNTQGSARVITPTTSRVTATPFMVTPPALSGQPRYNFWMNASSGVWSVAPSVRVNYTYQWFACDTRINPVVDDVLTDCVQIENATNANYLTGRSDVGKFLVARVAARNNFGEVAYGYSGLSARILAPPTPWTASTLSGRFEISSTLSVDVGDWIAQPAADFNVAWLRCDYSVQLGGGNEAPSNCIEIQSGTSLEYQLSAQDVGKFVTALVSAENSLGTTRVLIDQDKKLFGTNEMAQAVTAGNDFTCSRQLNETIWCMGENQSGQLGDGLTADQDIPVRAIRLQKFSQLATTALGAHMCALTIDRNAYCWGSNIYGAAGANASTIEFKKISAGGGFTCALSVVSKLYCWGYNGAGQLGIGNFVNKNLPSLVSLPGDVRDFATGGSHTCAVLEIGTVWCWGQNHSGQVGVGPMFDSYQSPIALGINDALGISAGTQHTCVLRQGGNVSCWGYGRNGQLGDGAGTQSYTPVLVQGLTDVRSLVAGAQHNCALTGSSKLYCWGKNSSGQLGVGNDLDQMAPIEIAGLQGVIGVTSGTNHTCATVSHGDLYCWGTSRGIGGGQQVRSPIRVTAFDSIAGQ